VLFEHRSPAAGAIRRSQVRIRGREGEISSAVPTVPALVTTASASRAARSGGSLTPCRWVQLEPDIGQQFVELIRGMDREAAQGYHTIGAAIPCST
jgi:hypothetical protein